MATPILTKLSKHLAYKLQDPVASGTTDGTRFTADGRLLYLTRAYRQLLRIVVTLYPGLITKIFTLYYQDGSGNTTGTGTLTLTNAEEIYDLFVREPSSVDWIRCTYIEPKEYISTDVGYNVFFKPDLNNYTYYYSIINNIVKILPQTLYETKYLFRSDIISTIETDGYTGTQDLDIPITYEDLLLALASSEAYLDLGEINLSQSYMNNFFAQFQILSTANQKKEYGQDEKTNQL